MKLRDIRSIAKSDLRGKTVLVRVDFNVPLRATDAGYEVDPHGDWRIRRSVDTIAYLSGAGAVVVLATHAGRPGGTVHDELRVKPMAIRLSALLNEYGVQNKVVWSNFERHEIRPADRLVLIASDCIGSKVEEVVDYAREGDIVMLENLRFYVGEETNDDEFAHSLAAGKDWYVNDQLGTSHRNHASVSAVTKFLPSYAGMLLMDEIRHLSALMDDPSHPFVFIMAGAKLETKLPFLKNMLSRVDSIFIGGAAANTLLAYTGKPVGKSKVSLGHEAVIRDPGWHKVMLPVDVVVAKDVSGTGMRTCMADDVQPDEYIYDVGIKTVDLIAQEARRAKLVVWNGPLGYFEAPLFAKSSLLLAERLAALGDASREIIIGGGDTEDLVEAAGVREKMSFVSTGGGAMLAFLSGEELPGLVPLVE